MKISIELKRAHIRAVMCLAAKQDMRYYLNGALLEIYPDRAFLVATDGHRLGVIRVDEPCVRVVGEEDKGPPAGSWSLILPRDLLERVKASRTSTHVAVEFDHEAAQYTGGENGRRRVTLVDAMTRSDDWEIDGKFPDWRRVLPACPGLASRKASSFNLDYVASFAKVAKELGSSNPATMARIWPNGDASAVVDIMGFPEFRGVLTPLRETIGNVPIAPPEQSSAEFKAAPEVDTYHARDALGDETARAIEAARAS